MRLPLKQCLSLLFSFSAVCTWKFQAARLPLTWTTDSETTHPFLLRLPRAWRNYTRIGLKVELMPLLVSLHLILLLLLGSLIFPSSIQLIFFLPSYIVTSRRFGNKYLCQSDSRRNINSSLLFSNKETGSVRKGIAREEESKELISRRHLLSFLSILVSFIPPLFPILLLSRESECQGEKDTRHDTTNER